MHILISFLKIRVRKVKRGDTFFQKRMTSSIATFLIDGYIDSLGDGIKIDFSCHAAIVPVMESKESHLDWGVNLPLSRYRPKKLSISFYKAACSLT